MIRQHINCNVPLFSSDDYNFIMQHHDERPRKKVLDELIDKYNTSIKRIYQIWRGEEANRIAWNQPIADISNITYASECLPVVNYNSPPAIPSSPVLSLKKNSWKKKTGKTSVASTETKTEMLSQRNANTTDNTDIIFKMGSELEEILKQMDDIK